MAIALYLNNQENERTHMDGNNLQISPAGPSADLYEFIEDDAALAELVESWRRSGLSSVAMDFEGEFNLHVYGEHLCLVQLFDGKRFYIVDALKVSGEALRRLLESPVEKIMFDCMGDSALARRCHGIEIRNVYDLRVAAMALGFKGGLSALIERSLNIDVAGKGGKKRRQMSNWMTRPLKKEQIRYALDDVRHLFQLKRALTEELAGNPRLAKRVEAQMNHCARPSHPDRPEWERAAGYSRMSHRTRVFLKNLFIARDEIARNRNRPASYLIDKKMVSDMAAKESIKGFVFLQRLRPDEIGKLEKALEAARKETGD